MLTSEFVQDYDVSSISGSESGDDSETESQSQNVVRDKSIGSFKQKLFFRLQTGQRVSVWKCLIMNVTENVLYENTKVENEVVEKLKSLSVEPRDNTHLRIVLLASGGHFVGCVFDGDAVVAHKTFHRFNAQLWIYENDFLTVYSIRISSQQITLYIFPCRPRISIMLTTPFI